MDIVAIISFAIKVMFGERIIQISCACIFYGFFYLFLHLSSGQENKYLRSLVPAARKHCNIRMFCIVLLVLQKYQKKV